MPQLPGGSDLHIDQALSNVSIAYFQDNKNYLADDIFPSVPVAKRSDLYRKYSKSDWRRTDAQKRAPGTESAEIGWLVGNDQYFCDVYAAHVDIDDQTRANADSDWNLDSDASRLITNHLLLQKDQLWCSTYFNASAGWTQTYQGVASAPSTGQFVQWDLAGSDPLKTMTAYQAAFRLSTGKPVTFMVVGVDVHTALVNHPVILDRIKYTQKGSITEALIAEFLNVKKYRVAWASQATGPQIPDARAQDAAANYSFIANQTGVLFGYAPDSPSKLEPSAGYTFNWKGYGAGDASGLTMRNFRQERLRSDRLEGEAAYVMKLVAPDCAVFMQNVVSV